MCYKVYRVLRVTNGGKESVTFIAQSDLPEPREGLLSPFIDGALRHKAPEYWGETCWTNVSH